MRFSKETYKNVQSKCTPPCLISSSSSCLPVFIPLYQALADGFLDGALPLDTFLEQFLALRSLAHKRRVRSEKLQDMLRQRSEDAASDAAQGAMTSSQASANQDP